MADQPPKYAKYEAAVDRMSPEERLRSLQAYAEQQKYVKPGDSGTLATNPGGIASLVFGGPLSQGHGYDRPLPPPQYESAQDQAPGPASKGKNAVGRWLDRRRHSKSDSAKASEQTPQQIDANKPKET